MRVAPGLGAALGTLGRLVRVLPTSLLIGLVGLAAAWAALTTTTISASVAVVPVAAVSVTAVDGGGPDGCHGPQCGGGGPDLTGPSGTWPGTGATSSSWPGGGQWSSTGDWPDSGRWANVEHWPRQGGPGDGELGGPGGPADLTSGAGGPGGLIGWIMGLVTQVLSSFGLDTPTPGPGSDASTSPGGEDLAGGLGEALPGSLGGSLPAGLADLPADLGDVAPVDLGGVLPVELPAGVEEPGDEVPGPTEGPRENIEQPQPSPNLPALPGGSGDQAGEFDGSGDPAPAAPGVWARMTGLDPSDHRGLDVQSGGWRPQPVWFATSRTSDWALQAWRPGTLFGPDPRTALGGYLGEVTRAVMTAAHTTGTFPPARLPGPAGGSAVALAGGSGPGGPGGGPGGGWRGDTPATGHDQPGSTVGAEGADLDGSHAAAAHHERMSWLAAAHGFHDPHNPANSTDPDRSNTGTVGGTGGQAWLTGGGMAVPTRGGGTLTLTPTTTSPHARTSPDLAQGRYLIHIDNAAAPGSYDFALDMPAGAHAVENTTGGVDILSADGQPIATIAAPWARDAHGRDLPTRFQVSRGAGGATVLTQHVGFDETTAFPVLADPDVGTSPGGPDQANAGAEAADTGGATEDTGGGDTGGGDTGGGDTGGGDGAEADTGDTTAPGDGTTEDTTPGDGTAGDDQDNTGDPADGADPAQDPGTTDEQPAPAGDEQPKPAPATSEQPALSPGPETAPSPGVDTPDIVLISTSGPLGEEPTNGGGGPGPEEDGGGGWTFMGFVKDFSNVGEGNTGWFNFGNNNSGWFNLGDGNTGDGNTGDRNGGDGNTGDDNTGNGNTGDRNGGDGNTGNDNTGNSNTGNGNAGNGNTGDGNAGDGNTGDGNAGDWNTGDGNAGDWNTGDRNSGDWNVGDGNAGDWNVGDGNTGDGNWGDGNSGDDNGGDYNPGNNNIGDFNAGDGNIGDGNAGDGNWGDWNTGDSNVGDDNAGDGNFGSNNLDSWNFGDGDPNVDLGGSPAVQSSGPPTLGVLAGDNLSELARALGVPVEELIAANQGPGGALEGRDPDLIFPGESFTIPDSWDGTWRSGPGDTVAETVERFSRSPGLGGSAGPPPTPEEVAAATEFYRGMSEKPGEFGKFLRDNPAVVEALASYGPPRTAEEVITAITGVSLAEAPPGSRLAYERTELLRAILAGSTTPTADLQAFLERLPPGVEREKLAGLFADHAPGQVWVSAGQAGEVDRKKLEWFVDSVLGYHPEPGTFGANFVTGLETLVADLPQGVIQSGIDGWAEAVNSLTTEYGDPPPRLTGETEAQYEARMLPFTDGVVRTLESVWRRWGPAVTQRDGSKAAHDYFTDPVGTFLEDLTPVAAVTGVGGLARALVRTGNTPNQPPKRTPHPDTHPDTHHRASPEAAPAAATLAAPPRITGPSPRSPAAPSAANPSPATGERPLPHSNSDDSDGATAAPDTTPDTTSGAVPVAVGGSTPTRATTSPDDSDTPAVPAATLADLTQAMHGHRLLRTEHLAATLGLTPTQLTTLIANTPGYRILGDPTTPHASAIYRTRNIPTNAQMRHHGDADARGPAEDAGASARPGSVSDARGRSGRVRSALPMAMAELRPYFSNEFVHVNGDLMRITAGGGAPVTVRVGVGDTGRAPAEARVDPVTGEHTITLSGDLDPKDIVRVLADHTATILAKQTGGRPEAGRLAQLDVLATERARIQYQSSRSTETTPAQHATWAAEHARLTQEFRSQAEGLGVLAPEGRPVTDPTIAARRDQLWAAMSDGARAILTTMADPAAATGASSKARSFLPLSEQFRRPYDAIDNITYYIDQHAPTAVRQRFNTEILPRILAFQAETMAKFKATYKQFFPSTSTERALPPARAAEAETHVRPLVDDTHNMLDQIRDWAHATGLPDLQPDTFDTALARGEQAWRQRYEQHKAAIDELLARYTYQGEPLGYIGSMQDGYRGPHKAMAHTDLRAFDVDLYTIHPTEFDRLYNTIMEYAPGDISRGKIFLNLRTPQLTPELRRLRDAIVDELEQLFPDNRDVSDTTIVIRREPPY